MQIRVLGGLEVWRDGRPQPLPASRRTRALLGYLAVSGRPQLRSHLIDLLWDGPEDPRAALRWSLTKLRPLLDDGAARLHADRERVALDTGTGALDLAQARALLESGAAEATTDDLRRAAALFRGELLEGLELPDCFRYQAWCVAEREAARAQNVAVLDALVARLDDQPEDALGWARARLALHPLAEAGHRAVMRLLGRLGRVPEALQQYESARRALLSVGACPSPDLEAARAALTRGGPAPRPQGPGGGIASAPSAPVLAAGWPLAGREAERAALCAALAAAAAGTAQPPLLVLGDPGLGKTRLMAELVTEAARRGGRVLVGRAFEAEAARPYGAWIDALRSTALGAAGARRREALAPLLPELGGSPDAIRERAQVFDAVAALLRDLGGEGLTVVVLDDVQWLDEASAALLHYVVRTGLDPRVVLAAAARPAELAENAAAHRALRTLARDGGLRELELAPLDAAAIAALARSLAPGVDTARVCAASEGNPLLAVEVVRALERGEGALSGSLEGLLRDRLERLDPEPRAVLGWASALGRSFDLATLAHVCGLPLTAVMAAVEALERHRVLGPQAAPLSGYDFVHDLLREAAYRRLSEPQRRLVHAQIAGALHALPDPDGGRAADVAHHADLGGDSTLAVAAAITAGERCVRLFAHGEAAELADRALPHAARLPQAQRLRQRIALARLRIHSAMSWVEAHQVEGVILPLIAEAAGCALGEVAHFGHQVLSYMYWCLGDHEQAHAQTMHMADGERHADPAAAARALGVAARCLAHLDRDLARAAALTHEAAELAALARVDLHVIHWTRGLLLLHAARYDEAVAHLERALSGGAREEADPLHQYPEWDCQARLVMIELERRRPADALARCPRLRALAARMGGGSEPAFSAALEALAHDMAADAGAPEGLQAAIDDLRAFDSKWMLAYVLTHAAALDLERGAPARCKARAEEALEAATIVGRRSEAGLARALLARLARADGRADEARRWLDEAAADLATPQLLSHRARTALNEAGPA